MRNFLSVQKVFGFSISFFLAAILALLAGCGPGTSTSTSETTTAAGLSISASPTEICTGNCTATNNYAPSTTVTLIALDSGNAALSGVAVSLTADTGILSQNLVTTDPTGTATFNFTNGTASKANRTATITATAAGVTATLPVQIVGSTLTVNASGTTVPGDGTSPVTMTFSAKDAGGDPIYGAQVTLSKPEGVNLIPASGKTDVNGQFVVSVTGSSPVSGSVTASAVGVTASAPITVSSAATAFGISQTQLNAEPATSNPTAVAMQIGDSLTVTVSAPASANVTFATTIGSWIGGTNTKKVPVVNGVASAVLNTTSAGLANVQVYDSDTPTISDSLTVSMSATIPYKITLQASPSVVPRSLGTTTGSSILVATVKNSQDQPVGNVPVAFTIVNPTGGGESVSPVVVYTANTGTSSLALGQAMTTFTSGSLSSGATGVKIHAEVLGTTVKTGVSPSGNDAAIVIGGTSGSIAFGQATVLGTTANATAYTLAMSVLVTDSNGNPAPTGTVVNLSAWPIAWSTGTNCSVDAVLPVVPLTFTNAIIGADLHTITLADTSGIGIGAAISGGGFPNGTTVASVTDGTTIVASADSLAGGYSPPVAFPYTTSITITGYSSTYFNEDRNENLFLDAGEDGRREYYYNPGVTRSGGTKDGLITPVNSAGGVVVSTNTADLPGTVTTDATGLGTFTLTYPKTSAIWTITRIRAKTVVQGSETTSEIQFTLNPLKSDVTPDCLLGSSPYTF